MDGVLRTSYTSGRGWQYVWYRRGDVRMWIAGNIFIIALISAVFIIGGLRGWDADSGYTHNESMTSQVRFLPEPEMSEENIRRGEMSEASARWYYWRLRPEDRSVWTRLLPWLCYLSHQVLMWAVIYKAQLTKVYEARDGKKKYSPVMSSFNWWAVGLNIIFHLLHLLQTHTTYDGLAPHVSIASSQSSVIMMLTLIIMMEYKERGLFFGWPTHQHTSKVSQKLRLDYGPIDLIRRYHGYAFSWAVIYTFWYHPMENTWGHAMGFIHTWLLLLQGSLMYTPLHLNKWWRVFLESFVTIHGGVVAAQTGGPALGGTSLWPMFVFGFSLAFVITQVFSLPVWNHLSSPMHLLPLAAYTAVVIWSYSWIPHPEGKSWVRMNEIIRIPSIYYLYFLLAWLLIQSCSMIETWISGITGSPCRESVGRQVCGVLGAVLVYGVMVGLSVVAEVGPWELGLVTLMFMFVGVFIAGAIVSFFFLKQVIPYGIKTIKKSM